MVNQQVSKLVGILLILGILAVAAYWYTREETQEGKLDVEVVQQVEDIETEIENLKEEVREINDIMNKLESYSFN